MYLEKRSEDSIVPPDMVDELGKEKETALAGLRKLCMAGEGETSALNAAAKAVADAGWGRDAEQLYLDMLDMPGVNPEVGALWVGEFTSRGAWQHRRQLRKLNPRDPLGRRAWYAYLGALGNARRSDLLRRALSRHGEQLRADTVCWGHAGAALAANHLYKETAEWMHDWRAHPDAPPSILCDAALAFRRIGSDAEAQAINRHALTQREDATTPLHRIWLACDAATAGDFESARSRMTTVTGEGVSGINEAAYLLVRAVLAVETAPQDQRLAAFREQRHVLKKLRNQAHFRNRALIGKAKRCIATMAKSANTRAFHLGGSRFSGLGHYKVSRRMLSFIWLGVLLICALARYFTPDEKPPVTAPVLSRPISTPMPTHRTYHPNFVSPLDQPGQFQLDDTGKLHGGPTQSPSP